MLIKIERMGTVSLGILSGIFVNQMFLHISKYHKFQAVLTRKWLEGLRVNSDHLVSSSASTEVNSIDQQHWNDENCAGGLNRL